jgi:FtsP/CotA-like multicopper oxidase with cupredoxin domain
MRIPCALFVCAVLGLGATGVASSGVAPQEAVAPDWKTALSLPVAPDRNPDPRVLEIDIEAYTADVEVSPGRRVQAWTYNGAIPGPLIRARVGDRLIVHFTNKLPAPTTIHWHGLRVPIQMDGVPGSSQKEVEPGESFTYDFVIPDAGLYWYHPHVMSAAQVGFGLYGAFLVDDPDEQFSVPEEHVLVLSDIDVTESGELTSPDSGGSTGMAFGREGNTLLVNGRNQPRVRVQPGVPQRWRVVNAAKSRYFGLDAGPGQTFTRIGGDGGLMEYPVPTDFLVLAPGERADVFFTPTGKPGSTLSIVAQLVDRGFGSTEARVSEDLLTLVIGDAPPGRAAPLPAVRRLIPAIDLTGATRVNLEFGIDQSEADRAIRYTINGKTLGLFAPVPARIGETQIWTVTNTTPWSHPFHLHGFFFQVLDSQGVPVRPLEWKDTVNVPFKSKRALAVRYDDRPGSWMFHCHVLDHADGGLMGTVALTREGEALPGSHLHPTEKEK